MWRTCQSAFSSRPAEPFWKPYGTTGTPGHLYLRTQHCSFECLPMNCNDEVPSTPQMAFSPSTDCIATCTERPGVRAAPDKKTCGGKHAIILYSHQLAITFHPAEDCSCRRRMERAVQLGRLLELLTCFLPCCAGMSLSTFHNASSSAMDLCTAARVQNTRHPPQ